MSALSLAVRWLHVVAMAGLLGGAALVWAALRSGDGVPGGSLPTVLAYEWLFWGAAGLAVLTGVGNLGALATAGAAPLPSTGQGLALTLKLVAVLGLLAGSVVRTVAVVRARAAVDGDGALPDRALVGLRRAYAATAGYLLAVVALAEVLAHG